MTRARNELIDPDTTPYYHCISRCVRRAFLCGEDSLTGKSYEHRKGWVLERLAELAEVYAIDVCAFAVMSNHHHPVLRIDRERAAGWDDREVMERWGRLFNLPLLAARFLRGEAGTQAERAEASALAAVWRERLCDISWFMRGLNEHLARRANAEDGCKGRFWEGRFKSQALLDEAAVLTCMSYVDLNPVRAGVAAMPEDSDFTAVQQRFRALASSSDDGPLEAAGATVETKECAVRLMPLGGEAEDTHINALGFGLADYLELLDWTGRAVRGGKRGHIDAGAPPILERLGLDAAGFVGYTVGGAGVERPWVLGRADRIREAAGALGRRFIKGLRESRGLYRPVSPI